jgi:hypothetical protein
MRVQQLANGICRTSPVPGASARATMMTRRQFTRLGAPYSQRAAGCCIRCNSLLVLADNRYMSTNG